MNRFLIVGCHHEAAHGATVGNMGQHQLQTVSVTEERWSIQLWYQVSESQASGTGHFCPWDMGFLGTRTLES